MEPQPLDYGIEPRRPGVARRVPWGTIFFTCGLGAVLGVPIFDAFTDLPGHMQSRSLSVGLTFATIAIGSGIVSIIFMAQRRRGEIGFVLGLVAVFLLPALMKA